MTQSQEFTPPHPLNTAVLFLVFNRPDTTKQVFEAIKQAKPPRLYVAADGARDKKPGEAERVKQVRDYVMDNIDWDCEVHTLFRDENLGCKYAVSGAITWFFENEEQGIILEDDCLPSQSFFWYCEELLNYYSKDLRVWHISGDSFQRSDRKYENDYYFSKYSHVWGWATWASRWRSYDAEMMSAGDGELKTLLENIFPSQKSAQQYWYPILKETSLGKVDTWDYQWTYTVWKNGGLSVLPSVNLISNIGFGPEATHTTDFESQLSRLPRYEMSLPISHLKMVLADFSSDSYTESLMFRKISLPFRVFNKVKWLASGNSRLPN